MKDAWRTAGIYTYPSRNPLVWCNIEKGQRTGLFIYVCCVRTEYSKVGMSNSSTFYTHVCTFQLPFELQQVPTYLLYSQPCIRCLTKCPPPINNWNTFQNFILCWIQLTDPRVRGISPLLCPGKNLPVIATDLVWPPSGRDARLYIDFLKIGVGRAHQRLAEVIKAMSHMDIFRGDIYMLIDGLRRVYPIQDVELMRLRIIPNAKCMLFIVRCLTDRLKNMAIKQ